MKKPSRLVCMVLVALGCSTPKSSGYLADYETMQKGEFLEQVSVDEIALSSGRYGEIVLGTVAAIDIEDRNGISAADCQDVLLKALVDPVGESPNRPVVLRLDESPGIARLDVAITEMSPGSAGDRVFAGEFGAGHAWVQIEGRVVDPTAGTLLFSFAERRRSSAAIGLKDLAGDAGPGEVRKLTEQIAVDLKRELRSAFSD